MKVLHLPDTVGGIASALAEGERQLGMDARVLSLFGSPYGYSSDIALGLEWRGRLGRIASRLGALARHCRSHDVYHFNFGSSLLHLPHRGMFLADLPLYRSGAVKIFTWQGCDARQKYPTMERAEAGGVPAACFNAGCYGGMCNSGIRDRWRRRTIDKATRYADHMFALNPDLFHFLPREHASFLPYAIRIPERLRGIRQGRHGEDGVVRIAHAPTQRAVKGTAAVLRAVERLREEFGAVVQLDIIEGVPNPEALARIAQADLFVDQLLIGWYGSAAVEAMMMAVPVVCYLNPRDLEFVPEDMRQELPLVHADSASLVDVLRGLLRERDQLSELGKRSQTFAEHWHNADRVAAMTTAVYRSLSRS